MVNALNHYTPPVSVSPPGGYIRRTAVSSVIYNDNITEDKNILALLQNIENPCRIKNKCTEEYRE